MQLLWKQFRDTNYEISLFGTVRNITTKKTLKPQKHYQGHLKVRLYFTVEKTTIKKKKKFKNYFIHRLVADCFLTKKTGHRIVDHIDCNKTNNCWINLEYVTQQINIQRAFDNGLIDMEYIRGFKKKAA